jgi:hypothetical protein
MSYCGGGKMKGNRHEALEDKKGKVMDTFWCSGL